MSATSRSSIAFPSLRESPFTRVRARADAPVDVAMGASGAAVMRHVFWQAMRPVLVGGTLGIVLRGAVSGVLS